MGFRLHPAPGIYIPRVWHVWVKSSPPATGIHIFKESRSSIPNHLRWELPQSRLCPQESPPNDDPLTKDKQDHTHRILKLPPREQTCGFPVFLPWILSGGLESHLGALVSIKPGHFLIQFDLF